MSIRELDKMERAVFLAIVKQSKLYPDEPFAYDVKAGQIYIINTLNVSIDRSEHMEIIRKLAEEDIIDADWLVPDEALSDSGITICDFARHRDWAEEHFISEQIVSGGQKYDDYCFISIHPSKIEAIKDTFEIACVANIFPAYDPLSLEVHCKTGEGCEVLIVPVFDDEKRPYKIVHYALNESRKRPGEEIGRGELSEKIRDDNGDELIKPDANIPKIFSNNSTIKEILSPLIELGSDYILIKQDVKLSSLRYEAIKAKAKRIKTI